MLTPQVMVAMVVMISIVVIVCVISGFRFLRFAIQQNTTVRLKQAEASAGNQEFAARIVDLEKRMANMETILLEHEKVREFDRALR